MEQNKIAIVDIETTGLDDNDLIVEIGIVELDLKTGTMRKLFYSVVRDEKFGEEHRYEWVFNNTDLTYEEVLKAPNFNSFIVKTQLQTIFNNYYVTAYNKAFDFKYLRLKGMNIDFELDCPMLLATDILKIKVNWGYKYPKVQEAWDYFFPKTDYVEIHRAYDDALHEAQIVYKMIQLKQFPINVDVEYKCISLKDDDDLYHKINNGLDDFIREDN